MISLSCQELQGSSGQSFHFTAWETEAKVMETFISSCLDQLGQDNGSSKVSPSPSSDQNGLSAHIHIQGKAKPLLGLWNLWTSLLEHFFLLLFKANVPPFGLVRWVPVKTLCCKQKKLPLALLITSPLQKRKIKQTREHQKRASVTHKVLRIDCGLEDLVKGRSTYHSRFRSCKKRSGGQNLSLQCLKSLCCK